MMLVLVLEFVVDECLNFASSIVEVELQVIVDVQQLQCLLAFGAIHLDERVVFKVKA